MSNVEQVATASPDCSAEQDILNTMGSDEATVDCVTPSQGQCEGSQASPDVRTRAQEQSTQKKSKIKQIAVESFPKVCELLFGKRVLVRQQPSEDNREELVEGVLRKAQGRSSVKILTDSGAIVLIGIQSVVSLEIADGTCIELVHDAKPQIGQKQVAAGGYPDSPPTETQASALRLKSLPGGLKYEVEKAAPPGARKAGNGSTVQVYYEGRLATTGHRFDKGPLSFKLGAHEVIKGFDKGVEGMSEGEKRKIHIPWKLAYGAEGNAPKIPPKADLIFCIELNAVA